MASTYSSNLKIELIGTGDQTGAWGTTTNENFTNVFEDAIVGRASVIFPSDANLTLTYTDSVLTQSARNLYLNVTSGVSLSTTRQLIVPTINKPYIVENNTSGGQSILVITAAGTGITVPNGKRVPVYADGTDVNTAFDGLAGDVTFTGTGAVTVPDGDTSQRPASPVEGMFRYNNELPAFEGYSDGRWGSISGSSANGAVYENKQSISANYTMTTNYNGESVGPITIDTGVTVTIPSGSRWVVL